MALVSLMGLAACTSGPPAFQVEPSAAVVPQPNAESLSIGSPSTPPPGEYRFARLYADGTVEARELFTSNGPGPWLSFTGRVQVPPSAVREALTSAGTPESTSEDRRAPCVLAIDTASTKWQGCAYPTTAVRLIAIVPRLTMPDVAATCDLRVCQVRIVREIPPVRHEGYGDVRQDRLLDNTGAFWCARKDDRAAGQIATLRVERGWISEPDALRVFRWVAGTLETDRVPAQSTTEPAIDSVMVRQRGGNWIRVAESTARRVRERWNQIAPRLPEECRPTR
jgi:hypothetical protein